MIAIGLETHAVTGHGRAIRVVLVAAALVAVSFTKTRADRATVQPSGPAPRVEPVVAEPPGELLVPDWKPGQGPAPADPPAPFLPPK